MSYNISEKKKLDNFCYKNNIKKPNYIHSQTNPYVTVTVKLDAKLISINGRSENAAARIMLEKLEKNVCSVIKTSPSYKKPSSSNSTVGNTASLGENYILNEDGIVDLSELKTLFLIDLENVPSYNLVAQKNCLYIGVTTCCHNDLDKYHSWDEYFTLDLIFMTFLCENNKILYTIGSGVKDQADHLMSALSYPIIKYLSIKYEKKCQFGYCYKRSFRILY